MKKIVPLSLATVFGAVNVFKLYEKVNLLFPKTVFEIKLMMHIVNVN